MARLSQAGREYFGYYGELHIQYHIEDNHLVFYETDQPVNEIDTFATFSEAHVAGMRAYVDYKNEILDELHKVEESLPSITEDNVIGFNPDGGW